MISESFLNPAAPALWVAVGAGLILLIWAMIYSGATCIFYLMEFQDSVSWEDDSGKFGFRRVSPDGRRYQYWSGNGWFEADEFELYCTSELGMSLESIMQEFQYSPGAKPHPNEAF